MRELNVKISARLGRSWRSLWPHLVDYEAVFFDAFKALQPDILHVHDRHPLPGAAKYGRWANETKGVRPVSWLYDAHEFLPTQHMPPPVELQQAWIVAESECIRQADAVVTVTDKIGELLRRRHRLKETPTVLRNLPSLVQADRNPLRTDVRTVLGLAPTVPLAVYVGGITPKRGVATLLDAQNLIPGLHVAIVCKADGDLRSNLREQARRLGTQDRVHLLDYVPASHVSRFISTADVGISALLPSPAHQEAAPTKVSEYLHGGLPVVVSDMRAQAERVRRLGFGKVYASGDPKAMAEALKHVLHHAPEYKERITEDVIRENSWEADISGLESLWARLSPDDRQVRISRRPESFVAVVQANSATRKVWGNALEELGTDTNITHILPQLAGVHGDLTDGRFVLSDEGQRFLDFWRREVAPIQGVFYTNSLSLVEGWRTALTTGILSMSGKPAVRLLGDRSVFDVDRLRSRYPDHWLHEISDKEADRLRSEFATLRESIRENDRMVLTSNLTTRWSLGKNTNFVPAPTNVVNRNDRSEQEAVRIGYSRDEPRSKLERHALDKLQLELGAGITLVEIGATDGAGTLIRCDIFIDSLSADLPTSVGMRAIAAGCVVVTGRCEAQDTAEPNADAYFNTEVPLLHSKPEELQAVIANLLLDRSELTFHCQKSQRFAFEHLSQSAVSSRLLSIISVNDA
ncbi:glycosyltransferase [Brevibacterium casei]|nr:glycosyltransferase [Brevibacterium casei]